jgi:predicted solute-binding protein
MEPDATVPQKNLIMLLRFLEKVKIDNALFQEKTGYSFEQLTEWCEKSVGIGDDDLQIIWKLLKNEADGHDFHLINGAPFITGLLLVEYIRQSENKYNQTNNEP